MSYEGYEQRLCVVGHLREYDALEEMYDPEFLSKCSCGEPFVFRWSVDETNGMDVHDPRTLSFPFEVKEPEEIVHCNLGHPHIVRECRYKIPSEEFVQRVKRGEFLEKKE